MIIGRYTPSAVICLCIVVIAFGVSQVFEEGPNAAVENRARSSATRTPGSDDSPDGWINSLLQLEGQVDAFPSNVPSVPGWDGIRVPPGDDVPGVVEPTPTSTEQVGEVDVVPTGSDTSTSVPGIVPPLVAEVVCAYDWDCGMAVRIVGCETGGTFDPGAVGDAGERGWFQIHPIHWSKPQCSGNLFDPAYNTACAYSIWVDQGWQPWSCY